LGKVHREELVSEKRTTWERKRIALLKKRQKVLWSVKKPLGLKEMGNGRKGNDP